MISWDKIKVVIFDVDGTLYDQTKLRRKMFFALISHYMFRPRRFKDLLILYHFRAEREKRSGDHGPDLENQQYQWCAQKVDVPLERIRKVINHWIFTFPNRFLGECIFPGVRSLFNELRKNGIKIAIYSDYKASDKIAALDLHADIIVCSTDENIDRFKPHPKAIHHVRTLFNARPEECLFIGDREELDGKCAINAGSPYLILDKKLNGANFFKKIQSGINELNPVQS